MSRSKACILVLVSLAVVNSSAEAGWHEFWDRVHLDFHRNNCWPEPFASVDRRAANAPFGRMVANGWKRQNTLTSHYFDPETHELTAGGKERIHFILKNVPEQHRTIFVSIPSKRGAIDTRIDSVQQEIARQSPEGSMPAVVSTPIEPRGWPADYINAVHRRDRDTMQNPRLPAFQAAGSAGG